MNREATLFRQTASDNAETGTREVQNEGRPIPVVQTELAIPCSRGWAFINAEDLPLVAGKKWHLDANGYARHTFRVPGADRNKTGYLYMHRLIADAGPGLIVDHVNHYRSDNRRANLRVTGATGNSRNVTSINQKTPGRFKGVFWNKRAGKWEAAIGAGPVQPGGKAKRVYLGLYSDPIEAARVYDAAARAAFGEFAAPNFPENDT